MTEQRMRRIVRLEDELRRSRLLKMLAVSFPWSGRLQCRAGFHLFDVENVVGQLRDFAVVAECDLYCPRCEVGFGHRGPDFTDTRSTP